MTAKASTAVGFIPWATAVHAREEARRRGSKRVGTEDLVLGLLSEPDIAQLLDCDLGTAREALDGMDRDALLAIGIDRPLDAPPAPTRTPTLSGRRAIVQADLTDHLPMTPVAKCVLEEAGKDRRRRHGSGAPWDPSPWWSRDRVLIALLSLAAPDPAAALLDALKVNRDEVRTRLNKASAAQPHGTADKRLMGISYALSRKLAAAAWSPHELWQSVLARRSCRSAAVDRRSGSDYHRSRPAVIEIIGGRRERTALMISLGSMPCR